MRSMPACRLLLSGMSMRRNLPPTGTAGLARSRVSGHRRLPCPPPSTAVTTFRIARPPYRTAKKACRRLRLARFVRDAVERPAVIVRDQQRAVGEPLHIDRPPPDVVALQPAGDERLVAHRTIAVERDH